MNSLLPPETLYEIFKHISHDTSTLFKCLLIDRTFCRFAIPYLWRQPFKRPLKEQKFDHSLVETIILSLNDNHRESVLNLLSSSKTTNLTATTLSHSREVLFKYNTFITELDTWYLALTIARWHSQISTRSGRFISSHIKDPHVMAIINKLGRALISSSPNLVSLLMNSPKNTQISLNFLRKNDLLSNNFDSIKKIKDYDYRPSKVFPFGIQNSSLKNLSSIDLEFRRKVNYTVSINHFLQLIQQQTQLQTLIIRNYSMVYAKQPLYDAFFTQRETLTRLEFHRCDFNAIFDIEKLEIEKLQNFKQLNALVVYNCRHLPHLPNYQYDRPQNYDDASSYSGLKLEKFFLSSSKTNSTRSYLLPFFEFISIGHLREIVLPKSCSIGEYEIILPCASNLVKLSIHIDLIREDPAFQLISLCTFLKDLSLYHSSYSDKKINDEFLLKFKRTLSSTSLLMSINLGFKLLGSQLEALLFDFQLPYLYKIGLPNAPVAREKILELITIVATYARAKNRCLQLGIGTDRFKNEIKDRIKKTGNFVEIVDSLSWFDNYGENNDAEF
ncbi:6546_t:CDS:1 [Ambispora gerdemannii]|uniref:6546_t:CDS:1 n=1 Tax=Ambispora gerdemannii TaxID=144530 RepID=A0A9N8VVS9_9GLOM|nr:6546_t:CDS:1 [Ambispora gerdemannii]